VTERDHLRVKMPRMRASRLLRVFLVLPMLPLVVCGATYQLKATPESIVWGYFSASSMPVLTVKSGDSVEIQSVWGDPTVLVRAGLPPEEIQPELREVFSKVKDRGPGPHLLTGPRLECMR